MSLSFHLPGAYIITFSLSCIWRQDQDVLCVLFTQALALLTECFCVSLFVFFFLIDVQGLQCEVQPKVPLVLKHGALNSSHFLFMCKDNFLY